MLSSQTENRKTVVEIKDGMFGSLELLHNPQIDHFVFKITDAADKRSYAGVGRKQLEYFIVELNNYLSQTSTDAKM